MQELLSVNNLSKTFFGKVAVNNVSFVVEKGNVYGILGPNGSGKSTTLGMLLTTINPSAGDWKWFGQEGTTTDVLKRIGAIIEQPNFYPYLSAYDNLKIVCTIKETDESRIDKVLDTVGLIARKNEKFSTYSLGMKQRLSIASALLNEPEVLILDEPTNGLDPEGIIQIRELIIEIAKSGTTILIASHMLDEIEKVCSHVIVLKNGASLYDGPVDGMSASKGYFELRSKNNENLLQILLELNVFKSINSKDETLFAYLEEDVDAEQLNRLLVEKGMFLTHLVKKRESLESQFLDLVKN